MTEPTFATLSRRAVLAGAAAVGATSALVACGQDTGSGSTQTASGHQGCIVAEVANSKITCPCHNSQFSAADGTVLTGPAVRALETKTVTKSGDNLTIT
jgi:nitrite reductase/ring-hydroxylating ferredoxin subunit